MRTIAIWLCVIPLAIFNGGLREKLLAPNIGRMALPMSGLILCALIFALAIAFRNFMRLNSFSYALKAGLLWLCLTVIFESGFGLLQGDSINVLLSAYDIRTGNLWLLVVASTLLAPIIAYKSYARHHIH